MLSRRPTAVRGRLADFCLGLVPDASWPPDVQWAVETLTPRRPPRTSILPWVKYQPSITIDLDPRKDDDFQLAVALVPYTIDGAGIADDRIIYSGNDTGTSACFELTEDEHQTTAQFMTAAGASAVWLIPFGPAQNLYS